METIDWSQLQALRQAYLNAQGFLPDYWKNEALLKAYELTLAQRIAWKWQAVLEVLRPLLGPGGLRTPCLVDWGAGTGIAARTVLSSGLVQADELRFYDRSARAMQYAAQKLGEVLPQQPIKLGLPALSAAQPFSLIISHVLSELPEAAQEELLLLCQKAEWVIWVEAGRSQESRLLSQHRNKLSSHKKILAPCPHQSGCGMLREGEENNWCHFFAPVPDFVFHSAAWRSYSQQLGIDLRSLPVSFLVAANPSLQLPGVGSELEEPVHVLGRSRSYKAFARWTACHQSGILTGEFLKRRSREIFKDLAEPGLGLLYAHDQLTGKNDKEET